MNQTKETQKKEEGFYDFIDRRNAKIVADYKKRYHVHAKDSRVGKQEEKAPLTPKVPVASVDVKTEQFEFAHGRKPRGQGYWGFGFGDYTNYEEKFMGGYYTEAKATAVKYEAQRGLREVTVLP